MSNELPEPWVAAPDNVREVIEAARAVVAGWPDGEIAYAVANLSDSLAELDSITKGTAS